MDHRKTRSGEPRGDVSGQVKMPARYAFTLGSRGEVRIVLLSETFAKGCVHFIAGLGDGRADDSRNASPVCAKRFHGSDGGFKHSLVRAAPTGMSRAYHPCCAVCEQHRGAIRGNNPER